jgi:hypothetical protein
MRGQSDGMTLPELGQEDIQALEESLSLADMKDKDSGTSDLRSTLMVHQQYVRHTLPFPLVRECASRRRLQRCLHPDTLSLSSVAVYQEASFPAFSPKQHRHHSTLLLSPRPLLQRCLSTIHVINVINVTLNLRNHITVV